MKMRMVMPLALLLGACASNPEPAANPTPPAQPVVVALTPAGNYEFSTVVDGQTMTGTMQITATAAGGFGGRILTTMFPEIPVTGASVEGNKMTVRASMPDGELTLNMTFTGMNFTGNWALGGQAGEFNGKKLP